MNSDIKIGDKVLCTSGSFKKMVGEVIDIKNDCYVVNINFFGKDVDCNVEIDNCKKDIIKIREIDKEIIERYLGKKDYVVRIRLDKDKTNLKIIVYYDGRKAFEVSSGKLILDDAYFFLKGNKSFELPNVDCINKLKELGFSFTMGSRIGKIDKHYKDGYRYRVKVDSSSNTVLYLSNEMSIEEKMNIILRGLKNIKEEVVHYFDDETLTNYFYIKDKSVDYFDFIKLQEVGISNTALQEGIKKIDFNEKIISFRNSYSEEEYDALEKIVKERILAYNKSEDDTSEKSYQQRLMNKMFDREEKEKLFKTDYCPFLNSNAFEMEYNLFEDIRSTRLSTSNKGRVDNIFIKGDKILFIELKYDEDVIGGTNGIHKHLIDLINGFEKNKEALEEIYDYVCDYNEVLYHFENKYEFIIDDAKRFYDIDASKEFIIICGYSKGNRDNVLNKLKEIYQLSGKDKNKRVVIEKEYELVIDGKRIHLEELTGKELVSLLKDRYNCETKIYLVDDNYTEFDKVNDLLK